MIDRGRQVAEGAPAQLKQRTSGRRVRCVTRLPLETVQQIGGVLTARQDGACSEMVTDRPEQTVRELLALDTGLSGLEVVSQTLDEAFLALVCPQEVAR